MQARRLSPEELSTYEQQGYLVYGKILTDDELMELRQYVNAPSRYVLNLETDVDESQAVDIILRAGEMSLHDAWILHGSHANHSPRRRCGYTMRYMPTEVKLDRQKWPHWNLWLVRGEDREGHNRYENA